MVELKKAYEEFKNAPTSLPATSLYRSIHETIQEDLKQTRRRLWTSVAMLHGLAALTTLVFCPQFGIGPFGGLNGVFGFFMEQGPMVCALFCGAFYMGVTGITLGLGLKKVELFTLAFHPVKYLSALSTASLLALMSADTFINGTWPAFDAEFLGFWLAGAIVCSIFGFNFVARRRVRRWHLAV